MSDVEGRDFPTQWKVVIFRHNCKTPRERGILQVTSATSMVLPHTRFSVTRLHRLARCRQETCNRTRTESRTRCAATDQCSARNSPDSTCRWWTRRPVPAHAHAQANGRTQRSCRVGDTQHSASAPCSVAQTLEIPSGCVRRMPCSRRVALSWRDPPMAALPARVVVPLDGPVRRAVAVWTLVGMPHRSASVTDDGQHCPRERKRHSNRCERQRTEHLFHCTPLSP